MKTIALLSLALASLAARAQSPAELVKAADGYRMSATRMQVETQINTFHADGSPDKERRYTVFVQANHQSLVLMQSPAEKGQKVLMLGDEFWLLMPGSQRPLRITPMQKLLGDASTGDIATMSWAEDYTAELVGEERCDAGPCLHLKLAAKRKGVSYQRIELWIGQQRHEPLKADLYVQSDKLAKQARFVMDRADKPTTVSEMVLKDQLSNRKETRVRYLSRKERTVPEAWLNPMFLARNASLE